MSILAGPRIVTRNMFFYLDPAAYSGSGDLLDLSGNGWDFGFDDGATVTNNKIVMAATADRLRRVQAKNWGSDNFTWTAWIYANSLATYDRCMIEFHSSGSGHFVFEVRTTGQVRSKSRPTGGADTALVWTSTGAVVIDTWYHLALRRTGTTYYIYVNGVNTVNRVDAIATAPGATETIIGHMPDIDNNQLTWDGEMGPIIIYDDDLTDAEVLQNFNAHKGRFGLS